MVLKSLVRYIINKYLKDYIEELDYEKLKLDLRNGNVCLEKLHLKPESLIDLSLPVTVATGFLEKLTLIIPWKNLYTHPTKVYIDGLYMLIVPKNEVRQDLTEYHADKMRRVQRKVDNLRKLPLHNKTDEKDLTFVERMRLQIMQNLEVTIRNLHLSYETISTTKLGHPFSFGLTIYYLEMTTSTNNRPIGKTKENSLVIFKMKEMKALSLYWNTKCKSRINMSFDDVVIDLKSKIATDTYTPTNDEMNYILHPVNLNINLTIIFQPGEHNFERPSYDIDIEIEQLILGIDTKQFSDLLDFIKFQNYTKLYDRCEEYRQLQMEHALNKSELTLEKIDRIHYLESKLDVFNIAYIRYDIEVETNSILKNKEIGHHHQNHHHSHNRIHHHQKKKSHRTVNSPIQTPNNHKWWNSWWKTKSYSKGERRKSSVSSVTTTNEDLFSEDSPNIDIKIKLKYLTLNLLLPRIDNNYDLSRLRQAEILCPVQVTNARIDFKRRAISSNISLLIDLQTSSIFGFQTDNNQRPLLATAASTSALPMIHIEMEFAPVEKQSDYRLCLIIEPLKISYDGPTINKIVECFDPNNDKLCSTLPEIKRRTIEEMERDLSQGKIFDMNIHFKKISLYLPENGISNKNFSMLYIDFDNLTIKSCLNDDDNDDVLVSKNDTNQFRYYMKYKLNIHNLQISYTQLDKPQLYIVRRIPLIDIDFYKCIYFDDADLVDWQIILTIAKNSPIELSKQTLIKLMNHLKSVPLLYANMMETIRRINLYFNIFPPHTTIAVNLSINRGFLYLNQYHSSIITDVDCHISKKRDGNDYKKEMIMSLNNLTISRQAYSTIKQPSPWLIYQNKSIELNYKNSLITRL